MSVIVTNKGTKREGKKPSPEVNISLNKNKSEEHTNAPKKSRSK